MRLVLFVIISVWIVIIVLPLDAHHALLIKIEY